MAPERAAFGLSLTLVRVWPINALEHRNRVCLDHY